MSSVTVEINGRETVSQAAQQARNGLSGLNTEVTGMKVAMTSGALSMAAVVGAIVEISRAVGDCVTEFAKQEKSFKQFTAAMELSGTVTKTGAGALENYAKAIASITGADNETVLSMEAFLASAGRNETQIKSLMSAAADLSAVTGESLQNAVTELNGTYSGTARQLAKLVPDIKNLTKEQMANGDAVDLVAKQYQGYAAQLSDTADVKLKNLKNAMDEMKGAFGESAMVLLNPILTWLTNLANGWATAMQRKKEYYELKQDEAEGRQLTLQAKIKVATGDYDILMKQFAGYAIARDTSSSKEERSAFQRLMDAMLPEINVARALINGLGIEYSQAVKNDAKLQGSLGNGLDTEPDWVKLQRQVLGVEPTLGNNDDIEAYYKKITGIAGDLVKSGLVTEVDAAAGVVDKIGAAIKTLLESGTFTYTDPTIQALLEKLNLAKGTPPRNDLENYGWAGLKPSADMMAWAGRQAGLLPEEGGNLSGLLNANANIDPVKVAFSEFADRLSADSKNGIRDDLENYGWAGLAPNADFMAWAGRQAGLLPEEGGNLSGLLNANANIDPVKVAFSEFADRLSADSKNGIRDDLENYGWAGLAPNADFMAWAGRQAGLLPEEGGNLSGLLNANANIDPVKVAFSEFADRLSADSKNGIRDDLENYGWAGLAPNADFMAWAGRQAGLLPEEGGNLSGLLNANANIDPVKVAFSEFADRLSADSKNGIRDDLENYGWAGLAPNADFMAWANRQSIQNPDESGPSGGPITTLSYKNLTNRTGTAFERFMQDIGVVGTPDKNGNIVGGTEMGNLIAGLQPFITIINNVVGSFGSLFTSLGSVQAILNPLQTIFQAMMDILGPLINTVLAPIVGILRIVGTTLGQMLAPVISALGPIIKVVGDAFVWLYNNVIRPFANAVIWIGNALYNGIVTVVNFLAGWLGVHLEKVSMSSGMLKEITAADLATTGSTSYSGTTTGASATYEKPRDITVNVTVNTSALVGSDGISEFALIIGRELKGAGVLGIA